jgi:hypothetical protein
MCMEDINIGRKSPGRSVAIAGTASVQQVLGASPKRIALIFSSPSAGRITFGTQNNLAIDAGITLYNSGNPFGINIKDYGNLICEPWFCVGSTVAQSGITEVLLPD